MNFEKRNCGNFAQESRCDEGRQFQRAESLLKAYIGRGMKRKKNGTKDTLGSMKARGEWLMGSWRSRVSLQSNGREKGVQMEEEGENGREREREMGWAVSAKVNRPRR